MALWLFLFTPRAKKKLSILLLRMQALWLLLTHTTLLLLNQDCALKPVAYLSQVHRKLEMPHLSWPLFLRKRFVWMQPLWLFLNTVFVKPLLFCYCGCCRRGSSLNINVRVCVCLISEGGGKMTAKIIWFVEFACELSEGLQPLWLALLIRTRALVLVAVLGKRCSRGSMRGSYF